MDLTDGDFRTAIEELISLYETLPATEVDVENACLMQVAHGWTAQIFRFAKSSSCSRTQASAMRPT